VIRADSVEVTTATMFAWRGFDAAVSGGFAVATGSDTPATAISSEICTEGVGALATATERGCASRIGREKNTDEATAATANRARSHF